MSFPKPKYAIFSPSDVPSYNPRFVLPKCWWQYLTPPYVITIIWLVVTFPLCFVHLNITWLPLLARCILIPVYLFFRPMWILWAPPKPAHGRMLVYGYFFATFAADLLPLVMYPYGYLDIGKLIESIRNLKSSNECNHDSAVQELDSDWFGVQPANSMHDALGESPGALLFNEYLQVCYFALFPLILSIHVVLWWSFRGRTVTGELLINRQHKTKSSLPNQQNPIRSMSLSKNNSSINERKDTKSSLFQLDDSEDEKLFHYLENKDIHWYSGSYTPELEQALMTLLVGSFTCWIFYMSYPVAGPLWCLPSKPDPRKFGYVFSYINMWMQDTGAAHGTATPSSHCAATVGVWVICALYHRQLNILCFFIVPGLVVATVFCHYHYAVDAIAGSLYGCVLPLISVSICNKIRQKFKLRSFAIIDSSHPSINVFPATKIPIK